MKQQTVVITGASAGIGRATARLFAERGANVVLLARGKAGLDAATADLEDRGGRALGVPTDMADPAQVEAAAVAAEEAFGPIDIWVNNAFTSVFAPFMEIEPDEYKRVTEVSYLGFVNGTRAALQRMIPRDAGVIVQVGSALGDRAIPLQSAYCGAKHAVNGFTSSVRTELMHQGSHVHVTVVQMPAVNTPQFSWVLSRLPKSPQPVPPIYQPEVAARAVVNAADHPHRKQYYVGASTAATILANKVAPSLLDRYLARTGYASQQTDETDESGPGARRTNLWCPADEAPGRDYGAHGTFDETSHPRSAEAALARHPGLVLAAATGAVATGLGAVLRRRRRR
ncbi:SDR family oxidoreductase [Streptomyces sp. NPDC058469]|uniref:SDR family oxidoreductase n=1 Tax=Streptomyces sp. NPDC058469 TaxID=3346514 RepID=UPI0036542984